MIIRTNIPTTTTITHILRPAIRSAP